MATVTAAHAVGERPWKIEVIVWSTAIVFWIAHLYAHGLSQSLDEGRRLAVSELRPIAVREAGILLAAIGPGLALLLGTVGLIAETAAVWLALGTGLATLAAEGIRYARLERLGSTATLAITAANVALGLLVVVLKVIVAH